MARKKKKTWTARDVIFEDAGFIDIAQKKKDESATKSLIVTAIMIVSGMILFGPPIYSIIFKVLFAGSPEVAPDKMYPILGWDHLIAHRFGLTFLAFSALAVFYLYIKFADGQDKGYGDIEFADTDEHGAARLMSETTFNEKYPSYLRNKVETYQDILKKNEKAGRFSDKSPEIAEGGVAIGGKLVGGDVLVHYDPSQTQNVIIGSTGSGKTTSFIVPSILSIANSGASMVINDPKGEILKTTGNVLEKRGYNVILLNYDNPTAGQMYNLLQNINDEVDEGMPHFYQMKAIEVLQKYLGYFLMVGTSDEDELNEMEFSIKALGKFGNPAVRGDEPGSSPDFEMITTEALRDDMKRLVSRYKQFGNYQNADQFVSTMNILLTKLFKQTWDDYKEVNRPVEIFRDSKNQERYEPTEEFVKDNEYLYYRQEQVIKAAINVLRTCKKDRVEAFFKDKIKSLEYFMSTYEPGTGPYENYNSEKMDVELILQEIEESSSLKSSHLISYFEEVRTLEETIYKTHEQAAKTGSMSVADMVVESAQSGSRGDSIWIDTPKSTLSSIILFVCRESHIPNSRHLGSVYRVLAEMFPQIEENKGQRNAPEKGTWDIIMDNFVSTDAVVDAQTATKIAGDKTRSSILVSTVSPMNLFADEAVISQQSQTSFSVQGLLDKPTAIFMNTPGKDSDNKTYTLLASLFVEQIYSKLLKIAKEYEGTTLPRSVYLLLDEFGNMPKIPAMGAKISLARGFNIKFNMIIQSYSQLDEFYKLDRDTITGNSSLIYLLTNDQNTAEEIAKRVGSATMVQHTASKSYGGEHTNTSEQARTFKVDLLDANFLMGPDFQMGLGLHIASRANAKLVEMLPFYKYPDIKSELGTPRSGLNIPRPKTDIARFYPHKGYKEFIYAYRSIHDASLLDMPLKYVMTQDLNSLNR